MSEEQEQTRTLEEILANILVRLERIDKSLDELRHDSRRVGVAVDMLKRDVDRLRSSRS
jgi:hypothetical protein